MKILPETIIVRNKRLLARATVRLNKSEATKAANLLIAQGFHFLRWKLVGIGDLPWQITAERHCTPEETKAWMAANSEARPAAEGD